MSISLHILKEVMLKSSSPSLGNVDIIEAQLRIMINKLLHSTDCTDDSDFLYAILLFSFEVRVNMF